MIAMPVRYDGCSVQNKRLINMDSLFLKERSVAGESVCLAVVCDGVGSTQNGAFASAVAVKLLSDWFNHLECIDCLGSQLRDCVLRINEHIVQEARRQGLRTASTLSALLLCGGRYHIANIGDSRVYRFDDEGIWQLTQDQTSNGKLTSWLGRPEETEVFYSEGLCGEGQFLICSDGLYKRMDEAYLRSELLRAERKKLKKTIERLIQYVVRQGETDNISLAIVICES